MNRVNKGKINKTIVVPIKLNMTCVNAARLAATVAPIAEITAVIVVPILSPNNTGNAA